MFIAIYIFLIISVLNDISLMLDTLEDQSLGAIGQRSAVLWNLFRIIFAAVLFAILALR